MAHSSFAIVKNEADFNNQTTEYWLIVERVSGYLNKHYTLHDEMFESFKSALKACREMQGIFDDAN